MGKKRCEKLTCGTPRELSVIVTQLLKVIFAETHLFRCKWNICIGILSVRDGNVP